MKKFNRILLIIYIIIALFIVGENPYFETSIMALITVTIFALIVRVGNRLVD
jgi:hypothetical protein